MACIDWFIISVFLLLILAVGVAVSSGYLREIIENCDSDRILFGSDGGSAENIIEYGIEKYLHLGIGEDRLRRIFYDNAQRLLPQKFRDR